MYTFILIFTSVDLEVQVVFGCMDELYRGEVWVFTVPFTQIVYIVTHREFFISHLPLTLPISESPVYIIPLCIPLNTHMQRNA